LAEDKHAWTAATVKWAREKARDFDFVRSLQEAMKDRNEIEIFDPATSIASG
jgi:hypothetical protein